MDQTPPKSVLKRLLALGGIVLLVIGITLLVLGACSDIDVVSQADRVAEPSPIGPPDELDDQGRALSLAVVDGGESTGRIATDYRGFAVYGNTAETTTEMSCINACLSVWLPVRPRDEAVGDGLDPELFSIFRRPNGTKQVAYNGSPLYTWSGDSEIGITGGAGVAGTWFALTEVGGFIS